MQNRTNRIKNSTTPKTPKAVTTGWGILSLRLSLKEVMRRWRRGMKRMVLKRTLIRLRNLWMNLEERLSCCQCLFEIQKLTMRSITTRVTKRRQQGMMIMSITPSEALFCRSAEVAERVSAVSDVKCCMIGYRARSTRSRMSRTEQVTAVKLGSLSCLPSNRKRSEYCLRDPLLAEEMDCIPCLFKQNRILYPNRIAIEIASPLTITLFIIHYYYLYYLLYLYGGNALYVSDFNNPLVLLLEWLRRITTGKQLIWMVSPYLVAILTFLHTIYSLPTSTPATWAGSTNYSSGSFKVMDSAGELTITYGNTFLEPPQKMILGLISQIATGTSLLFNVSHSLVSNNETVGKIKYALNPSLVFTEFNFRWLVISKSYTDISCNRGIAIVSSEFCEQLKTGTGQRNCIRTPNATAGTGQVFNLSHTNVILTWFDSLIMKTVTGEPFQFSWESVIINPNNYTIYLNVYGNTTISKMTFSRLTYDLTVIQSSQTIYLDGGYLRSTGDYSTLSRTFLYKNLTSFMAGLAEISFHSSELLNWSFDVDSITTSGAMTFSSMAIVYWNYRYRICDPIYPFYNQTDNLCYDMCTFYYFQNTDVSICEPCHYTCLNCSNNTLANCTACVSSDFRTLTSNHTCPCNTGYYDDGGPTCQPCSYTCLTCNTSTQCLTCPIVTVAHRVLTNKKCECSDPYFQSGVTICSTCINTIPACIKCTSTTICAQCNSTLFYTVQSNTCVCMAQYILVTGECKKCSSFMDGCISCSSSSVCTDCDITHFFELNTTTNQCYCKVGYFKNGTQCSPCPKTLYGCNSCSSDSVCTVCDLMGGFFLSNSLCYCNTGKYLNSSIHPATCEECSTIPHCLTCTNETFCTSCDPILYYALVQGGCECMYGYNISTNQCSDRVCTMPCNSCVCECIGYGQMDGVCSALCGDNFIVKQFEECDDGNNVSNDGCSKDCRVEPDFKCNTVNNHSECQYSGVLNFSILSFDKDPYSNSLIFTFKIGPQLYLLQSLDFSQIVIPNLPVYNASYSYSNGTLQIVYQFNTSLDKQTMVFNITPSLLPTFDLSPNTTIQVPMTLESNQPLIPYEDHDYQNRKAFEKIYIITIAGSYATLVLSIFTNKIVGLQMIGVLQIAFFVLADYDFLHPLMAPLRLLKYVNGYNFKVVKENYGVPIPFKAIDYNQSYLSNVNIMLLVPILYVAIALIIYLAATMKKESKSKSSILRWSKNMIKQYFLAGVMFSTYNIGFSMGLHAKYSIPDSLNVFAMALSLILIWVLTSLLIYKNDEHFGQFNSKFKPSLMPRNYMMVSIVYRVIVGFLMSYHHDSSNVTIITTFLSLGFLIYTLADLPFTEGYHNYRGIFCQISTITILFISMYYRSMKSTTPIVVKGYLLNAAYLKVLMIMITIIMSLIILCYEIIESARQLVLKSKKRMKIEKRKLMTNESLDGSRWEEFRMDSSV